MTRSASDGKITKDFLRAALPAREIRRVEKMDFYRKIAIVCKNIPKGKVATYGQIALLCGAPRHARQVGYALNKKLSDVPAHRVVNHKGCLSGAMAFQTPELQAQMLSAEGVTLKEDGSVDLKQYGWQPSRETLEEIHKQFKGVCL